MCEKDIKFDVADSNDRTVYSFVCFNKLHFYCTAYALKRAKSYKEVQKMISPLPKP